MGFVVSMQVQHLKWEVLKDHPVGLFLDTFVPLRTAAWYSQTCILRNILSISQDLV